MPWLLDRLQPPRALVSCRWERAAAQGRGLSATHRRRLIQKLIVWSLTLPIGKSVLIREQVSLVLYEFNLDTMTLGQNLPSLFMLNSSSPSAPKQGVSKLCWQWRAMGCCFPRDLKQGVSWILLELLPRLRVEVFFPQQPGGGWDEEVLLWYGARTWPT